MKKNKEDIEEKKLNVEKAKVLEGILRTLLLVLIANTGGVVTLLINFNQYERNLSTIFLILGTFIEFWLIIAVVIILFYIKKLIED